METVDATFEVVDDFSHQNDAASMLCDVQIAKG
jgi:hypothetical protein